MDPITIAALIGGGASILSGLFGSSAASKAADSQEKVARDALELQKASVAQARLDSAPWLDAGRQALTAYMQELGFQGYTPPSAGNVMPPPGTTPTPTGGKKGTTPTPTPAPAPAPSTPKPANYLGFQQTPGYQFQVQEAEKGALNNLAALGMKNSGAALQALTKLRSGLANQEYGTFMNHLAGMSGVGQTQVNQTNALTQNSVLNQGQLMQDAGAARASGYVGGANAWTNSLGNFANNMGNWLGQMG